MSFPFPGIGVVFDIDGFNGGSYGYSAWQFFMAKIDPEKLGICIFVEGDTNATLTGQTNEFCIGIYSLNSAIPYIRTVFEDLDDQRLAPFHRRFIEKIALDTQSLVIRGQLDGFQRFVTDHYSFAHYKLCKDAGWGYLPKQVPSDIDPDIYQDLKLI